MANAQLFLKGAQVTSEFRSSLFDAANRAGITPNEYVICAAAEKLAVSGANFNGVFKAGDFAATHVFARNSLRKDLGREPTEAEVNEYALDLAAIQFGKALA